MSPEATKSSPRFTRPAISAGSRCWVGAVTYFGGVGRGSSGSYVIAAAVASAGAVSGWMFGDVGCDGAAAVVEHASAVGRTDCCAVAATGSVLVYGGVLDPAPARASPAPSWLSPADAAVTLAPSRNRSVPSTTTLSPGCSPDMIAMRWPSVGPSVTFCTATVWSGLST